MLTVKGCFFSAECSLSKSYSNKKLCFSFMSGRTHSEFEVEIINTNPINIWYLDSSQILLYPFKQTGVPFSCYTYGLSWAVPTAGQSEINNYITSEASSYTDTHSEREPSCVEQGQWKRWGWKLMEAREAVLFEAADSRFRLNWLAVWLAPTFKNMPGYYNRQ